MGEKIIKWDTTSHKIKMDKLDFIRIENVSSLKDTVKKMKRQATDWEKIFAKHF